MLIIVRPLDSGRKQGLFSKIPLVHVCFQIHLTGACQLLNCEQIYSSDIDSSIATCKTYPSLWRSYSSPHCHSSEDSLTYQAGCAHTE